MARLTKAQEAERQEIIESLRGTLPPGSTVYTVLRHVSRSGMSRHIDVYAIEDGAPSYLSGYVAKAIGERRSNDGALVVSGCGMDMGFHIAYSLSHALYPDGFTCTGEGGNYCAQHGRIEPNESCPKCGNALQVTRRRSCPSNDHSNGDRDYTPHHHKSGGYALRHDWL